MSGPTLEDDLRSARIMAKLPDGGPGVSVTYMARALDMPRGFVYRRLEALRQSGAAERWYGAGKYLYRRTIPGEVCENHPSRPAIGMTEDDIGLCEECAPDD